MSTVTFTAIGGGSEIGANSYAIAVDNQTILLDCGMHPKKEGLEALPEFGILRKSPEAVIVSHAHIDHCGAVPYLLKEHPSAFCYATQPTVNIMDRMLHNSVSVMTTMAIERGISEYPLYGHADVDYAIRRSYGLAYEQEFELGPSSPFRASLHHSGHVLGGACILLNAAGHTLFYTGDVCMSHQELMGGLTLLDESITVDTLIIESTRGTHENGHTISFEAEVERFGEEIRKVLERGGSVLVPSFALGRTQELLNIISRLQESGMVPDAPVYASGLGRAVYEVYNKYSHYLRPDKTLRPLCEYRRIGDVWERDVRRQLLDSPGIIVATSGMMIENTPSSLIAMEMAAHTHHGIFFVGYLDPDTLGYKLLRAEKGDRLTFELKGPQVPVRLENRQSFSFSAHATREDLCKLVDHVTPKNIIFVHGDADAISWMHENTASVFRKHVPAIGRPIELKD
ncbi:MAG: MBL fold metallo-hydrolase [Candidatus Hydrogenedentes bacterium]|nr:MBL fold metallo-hydrolase [Candidatus Hydrogenedentota bacterium]